MTLPKNLNLFPCHENLYDSTTHWPDADLSQLASWGCRGARICTQIEYLLGKDDQPNIDAIKTLAGIIARVSTAFGVPVRQGSGPISLGIHYDYGAWGARSFRTDLLAAGSSLRPKVWMLYKRLSEILPPYVQFEATPNELSGPKKPGDAPLTLLWHEWYQYYFLSAIRAGNKDRFVWLSPPNNWEIARLLTQDGTDFIELFTAPNCGRGAHDYTGLNPGVNPTTFTIPESELEAAFMSSMIDLKRFCHSRGEAPMLGECFGFDFTKPMPDRARAFRYIDTYAKCANAVGIPLSAFHADMIVGSTPGKRALPLAGAVA